MKGETVKKKRLYLPFILLVALVIAMLVVYWMAFKKESHDTQYLSLVTEQRVLSQGCRFSQPLG